MKVMATAIPGVLILEPKVFGDERGFFMESFNQKDFNAAVGHKVTFVQDNHSRSAKGVLRGLHYQKAPHAQGKLVHVTQGSGFDVAVDIRPGIATYGKWVRVELSGQDHRQMWIPPGLAHGFLVTSDSVVSDIHLVRSAKIVDAEQARLRENTGAAHSFAHRTRSLQQRCRSRFGLTTPRLTRRLRSTVLYFRRWRRWKWFFENTATARSWRSRRQC